MYLPHMMCEEPQLIQPLKTIHFIQALLYLHSSSKPNQTIGTCTTLHISDRRRVFYNRAKSLPIVHIFIYKTARLNGRFEQSSLLYKHLYVYT